MSLEQLVKSLSEEFGKCTAEEISSYVATEMVNMASMAMGALVSQKTDVNHSDAWIKRLTNDFEMSLSSVVTALQCGQLKRVLQ